MPAPRCVQLSAGAPRQLAHRTRPSSVAALDRSDDPAPSDGGQRALPPAEDIRVTADSPRDVGDRAAPQGRGRRSQRASWVVVTLGRGGRAASARPTKEFRPQPRRSAQGCPWASQSGPCGVPTSFGLQPDGTGGDLRTSCADHRLGADRSVAGDDGVAGILPVRDAVGVRAAADGGGSP